MLDGQLRGRNELIQDSIYKDTGIRRCRKQVSSHLQVLKQHLKDQPAGELPAIIFMVSALPTTTIHSQTPLTSHEPLGVQRRLMKCIPQESSKAC